MTRMSATDTWSKKFATPERRWLSVRRGGSARTTSGAHSERRRAASGKTGPPVNDDLVCRDFTAPSAPNTLWLADIPSTHRRAQALPVCYLAVLGRLHVEIFPECSGCVRREPGRVDGLCDVTIFAAQCLSDDSGACGWSAASRRRGSRSCSLVKKIANRRASPMEGVPSPMDFR